ncbi:MAG: T9SS type A sorting domain-containing protein [Bacteroidetes bacterium]|nr:T9SS type A sorting domain-containing protein [Bacteroidota bacterium]
MKLIFTLLKHSYARTLAFTATFIVAFTNLNAQVCSSPTTTIYGLNGNGTIYPISLSNANVGTKVNTATGSPSQANAIGYNNLTNTFYYFNVNPTSTSGGQFVSYNATLNLYTTLATSPVRATVHAGCVSFGGTGYYCTDVNGDLFYYNIVSNTWTTITTKIVDQSNNNVSTVIQTQNSGDMAIDGLGNLWIVTSSSSNWALYEIKAPLPTTNQASVTAIQVIAPTSTTPSSQSFQGIAFDPSGNMYLSTSGDKLYKLTSANAGSLSLIGSFNTSGVGNDLTSCSYPLSILPVNWVSFTAAMQNKSVSLNWTVSQSINNKGFYVERSTDNTTWEALGFIEDNSGNDLSQTSYTFSDANPAPGVNYYRIHQVDYDDNSSYSSIKMITTSTTEQVSVWPNPARSTVNIQNNGTENDVKMQIIDPFGKLIAAATLRSGKNEVNISNLPSGTYIVHTQNSNGQVQNQKIVKL